MVGPEFSFTVNKVLEIKKVFKGIADRRKIQVKGPRFYLCTQLPYLAMIEWNRSILTESNIVLKIHHTWTNYQKRICLTFVDGLFWLKNGLKVMFCA